MVDTSDIKRRVETLERATRIMSSMMRKVIGLIRRPRKVNSVSREMSKEESRQFKRQMARHGMEDEESGSSVGVQDRKENR